MADTDYINLNLPPNLELWRLFFFIWMKSYFAIQNLDWNYLLQFPQNIKEHKMYLCRAKCVIILLPPICEIKLTWQRRRQQQQRKQRQWRQQQQSQQQQQQGQWQQRKRQHRQQYQQRQQQHGQQQQSILLVHFVLFGRTSSILLGATSQKKHPIHDGQVGGWVLT